MSAVVKYRTDQGVFHVLLAKTGDKYLHIIPVDAGGITVVRVPRSESKYMTETTYPVRRAIRRLRACGRKFGITKTAKKMLKEVG